ncbi:hypothetical protein SB49_11425 [Sediminicola sp. YIK13]|uniref:hypothetical protein n=1 Tax=Sediminicola sp. YIK13 TaxID=1453352 RepID=UPI00071FF922|nr:hypothetical protein [Sediminicola sp. YIK13]ALM08349.1 hypothetical protein SB49_11425 [Sediminicola sp. YIK13]
MKHIHFNKLNRFQSIILLLIGLVLILIGFYKDFLGQGNLWTSTSSVIGYIFFSLHFSKMFWYKNYVEWNKKGVVYRIKTRFGKTLRFNQVGNVVLKNDVLFVTLNDGSKTEIDLHEVFPEDQKKLQEIFIKKVQ